MKKKSKLRSMEKESKSQSMEKESKPQSMKNESKLRPMEKESKSQSMEKESKSQSVDETSKLGGDLPSSEPFSLPFEEVIQFARGSVGPDLSMGPSPLPPLSANILEEQSPNKEEWTERSMEESDLNQSSELFPSPTTKEKSIRSAKVAELIKKFEPTGSNTRSFEKTTEREYVVVTHTFPVRVEQKIEETITQITQEKSIIETDQTHMDLKQFLASDDFEPLLFFSYPRSSLFPSAIGQ